MENKYCIPKEADLLPLLTKPFVKLFCIKCYYKEKECQLKGGQYPVEKISKVPS